MIAAAQNFLTLEGALLGAVSALAASVVFLFKRIDREIDRCDKDRRQLWERVIVLENISCHVPDCPALKRIKAMGPVVPISALTPPPPL